MFSKKTVAIVGVVILIAISIIVLSISSRKQPTSYGIGQVAIPLVAPFQKAVTRSIRFVRDVWSHYFYLVSVARENEELKQDFHRAIEKNNQLNEVELSNTRLRNLLNFQKTVAIRVIAAEVIAIDPSPWYKTIIIDKGKSEGIEAGLPVVVAEGIVGQVIEASQGNAKVLLVIDRNSAVDALIQRTRARGIVKGESEEQCQLNYVLRKYDINVGDTVVSSGLDGVFPKGLRVGRVSSVIKPNSGIFQGVVVTPYVDFEKLEEVLIIMDRLEYEYVR
ncbi:rod shape-determining protein MreC [Thermodesulfobacteriota bacterium]